MNSKIPVLAALAVFATAGVAAIISERNDLFTYAPNYATFPSGIPSRFIPYGTYTDGAGSTEYYRVTSNLIGVVASAFDGKFERNYVPGQDYIRTNHWSFYERAILTPATPRGFIPFRDNGEFLHSAQNNSLRILDRLNKGNFIRCTSNETYFSYSMLETGLIELNLAREFLSSPISYHDGMIYTHNYGSRRLDDLVTEGGASIDPPIPTSWTTALPFRASDSNAWATVWPTYSALTNDIHFFPSSTNAEPRYFRWHLSADQTPQQGSAWFNPEHLRYIWGSDVQGGAGDGGSWDLEAMLNLIPLPYTMEDVLSYDTGWKYEVPPELTNDYWTVSGPIGPFTLHHYEEYGEVVWWSNVGDVSDYYVELTYYGNYGYWLFRISPSSDPFSPIYEFQTFAEKEAEYLDLGYYHAQHIQLFANQDDYNHWTNMTRRLDWQRLGIICQLERQMEQTYLPRQEEDELPFVATEAHRSFFYTGEKTDNIQLIHYLDQETYDWHIETTNFTANGVSWSLVTQNVNFVTNKLEMCYPTARTGPCLDFGDIKAYFPTNLPVLRPISIYEDVLLRAAEAAVSRNGFTNGTITVGLEAGFSILSAAFVDGSTYGYNVYLDWRNALGSFTPESGDPEYFDDDSYSDPEVFLVPGLVSTNAFVAFEMETGKLATSLFTDSIVNNATPDDLDPVDRETIVTNFVAYPTKETWEEFIGWQDRPTLDVMIDAKGAAILDEMNPYDIAPLEWDDLAGLSSNVARRAFRMSPFNVAQENKYNSDNNRLKMLLELDSEVKSRFESLAGVQVQRAAEVLSNFQAGEEAAIKNDLESTSLKLNFSLIPSRGPGFNTTVYATAHANVDAAGNVSGLVVDSMFFSWIESSGGWEQADVPVEDSSYVFAAWTSNIAVSSTTNTPSVEPVRVDGHQDQMIKTLWKFKNLRDPTL